MKKMRIEELNTWIADRKADVERQILKNRSQERITCQKKRDPDEVKILDKLCIERWKKAEREGKIKYISDRKWYYEFD